MKIAGRTDIGLLRELNQDALCFNELPGDARFAIVCDGMGGANGGEIASRIAIETVKKRVCEGFNPEMGLNSINHLLTSAIAAANACIYDEAKRNPSLDGMGTTIVTVLVHRGVAHISHVGDSRLYLLRDGKLSQITRDHSVVQEMIERGELTREQARTHPRRNYITRALGVQSDEEGEYDELELEPKDRMLLCTDGLTNMVDTENILSLASGDDLDQTVDDLVQAALDGGGSDNITVILMEND